MKEANSITTSLLNMLSQPVKPIAGDTERGGITYCGKCGEAKAALIDWFPDAEGNSRKKIVPVTCACKRAEYERLQEEDRKFQFKANMRNIAEEFGIPDPQIKDCTFLHDDGKRQEVSRMCRKYVEHWEEMRGEGTGILLYGSKGTGKSFYAGCIVNALLEKQIPAALCSASRLMTVIQGVRDKQAAIDHLQKYRLLVLDDLGAERTTSYASEVIFSVIDARYRSGLPMIVTTNLDINEMKSESVLDRARIYDRVLEMCPIAIQIRGDSRRKDSADDKKRRAWAILAGKN